MTVGKDRTIYYCTVTVGEECMMQDGYKVECMFDQGLVEPVGKSRH